MKDAPSQEDKHNIHSFLVKVVEEEDYDRVAKLGNLRDDKEINELGVPKWTIRGCFEMARISGLLMHNSFFQSWFLDTAKESIITSLSREGFMIRQATTQTKQVADITKRRKINKGMFGSKKIEEQGGDTIVNQGERG
jgi:hypothetical protein